MTKIEKINKLNDVLGQLKNEFIGLDNIIDEIGKSIYPWYITPEVINRPITISLWGMTGTGKTSVVNRLIELLELNTKTLYFDCGTMGEGDNSISKKICDYLIIDDINVSLDNITKDMVFVFDEFQHTRSIDEDGNEVKNQALHPVWNLMDSGKLNLTDTGDWQTAELINFIEDLKLFLDEKSEYGNIRINKGYIENPEDVKVFLESMGAFNYDRGIPGMFNTGCSFKWEVRGWEKDEDNEDPYRPLYLLEGKIARVLIKKFRKLKDNPINNARDLVDIVNSFSSLSQFVDFLEESRQLALIPEEINCSKSLIFVLGNLDEAFRAGNDTTPDLDADIFYQETSRVTIGDIKNALKNRFRPEQIARLGNTLIKYPTLKKEHFNQIINKEVTRICDEFEKNTKIKVTVTDNFKKLLYSEGVFPTQGVRPVFTTINTMFTPLLSTILVKNCEENKCSAEVDVTATNFRVPCVTATISYSNGEFSKVPINLILGADRFPDNRKTRFVNGIHEAGHAIVYAFMTGKSPISIMAVSSDHGGFCTTFDPERNGEIDTIKDVTNEVCVSMAGWCAEKLVYGDDRLLGSSKDLEDAWETLSHAIYKNGYWNFIPYSHEDSFSSDGIPSGMSDKKLLIDNIIEQEWKTMMDKTKRIISGNRLLLLETGKLLGQIGEIDSQKFIELIKLYGNSLNEDSMENARKLNSYDYYEQWISNCIKEFDK